MQCTTTAHIAEALPHLSDSSGPGFGPVRSMAPQNLSGSLIGRPVQLHHLIKWRLGKRCIGQHACGGDDETIAKNAFPCKPLVNKVIAADSAVQYGGGRL